ncbi:unnamed protein product [Ixodes pacificus]
MARFSREHGLVGAAPGRKARVWGPGGPHRPVELLPPGHSAATDADGAADRPRIHQHLGHPPVGLPRGGPRRGPLQGPQHELGQGPHRSRHQLHDLRHLPASPEEGHRRLRRVRERARPRERLKLARRRTVAGSCPTGLLETPLQKGCIVCFRNSEREERWPPSAEHAHALMRQTVARSCLGWRHCTEKVTFFDW